MSNVVVRIVSNISSYALAVVITVLKMLQDRFLKIMYGYEKVTTKESFYDLVDKKMNKEDVPMSLFKVDEYGERGLKVLAFPCNQFGGQEPGTHEEILKFVDGFFPHNKVTWFKKGHVNGGRTREVYSFLKRELPNEDGTSNIRWNFAKFLVDHEGKPFKRYAPPTPPLDLKDDIELLLKKKEKSS